MDENIKHLAKLVPSYIKDTTHFLQLLSTTPINEEDLLVTIDISSLYTNIIHEKGLQAMQEWMDNNIDHKRTEFIKKLGNLVLKHNCFEFNGQIFLQQQGTAMGTRMAPNYTIIFMHKIETELLQKSPLQPTFLKRFIDDIFLIWPHGEEKLQEFLEMINTHHKIYKVYRGTFQTTDCHSRYPSIQREWKIADKSVP